jgi:hypothetical protein
MPASGGVARSVCFWPWPTRCWSWPTIGSNVRSPTIGAWADLFDRLQPEDTARQLIKRLEQLGYRVTLQNLPTDAMPSRRRLFLRQHRK